ncbi:class E sortase [Luteimicrobium subarcticum]|uniref:Sortase A n=1 Tax=Luteimicrobium subarcticum TaxID=620910 RepID=A0A2M8WR48_9MICO|nr:class E sortase [Luteimicrobium subarcticum]PJI93399.1 sortase A [Luteimicrobium subarcticum]
MTRHIRHRRSAVGTVVGVVGEVFITVGVLLGLFLTWELWWTNVEAVHDQQQRVEALGWAYQPDNTPDAPQYLAPSKKTPVVMKEPAHAVTFATMYVPRFGETYARTVSQGTDRATVLDVKGIGHYEGTAMPGGVGNFSVAGHRTTFGKPFNKIADLKEGDPVVVQTKDGWYVYEVTSTAVVSPGDSEVIAPVPGDTTGKKPTERFLTMTACHPMYSLSQRFVVHAKLSYWAPTQGDKIPVELVTGSFSADRDVR